MSALEATVLLTLQRLLLIPLPSFLLLLLQSPLPCHSLLRMLPLLKPFCLPLLSCRPTLRRHPPATTPLAPAALPFVWKLPTATPPATLPSNPLRCFCRESSPALPSPCDFVRRNTVPRDITCCDATVTFPTALTPAALSPARRDTAQRPPRRQLSPFRPSWRHVPRCRQPRCPPPRRHPPPLHHLPLQCRPPRCRPPRR